jgi:hypothetical protein
VIDKKAAMPRAEQIVQGAVLGERGAKKIPGQRKVTEFYQQ